MFVIRRMLATIALGAAVVVPLTAMPADAEDGDIAEGGDITCLVGQQITTYNPGMTLTPQSIDVHLDRNFGPCVSLSNPDVTSGTTVEDRTSVLSCADLLAEGEGTREIEWNTGDTSTYSYTRIINIVLGQIVRTETGNVTDGLFKGSSVVQTTTLATLGATACLGEGVKSNSGVVTLNII